MVELDFPMPLDMLVHDAAVLSRLLGGWQLNNGTQKNLTSS